MSEKQLCMDCEHLEHDSGAGIWCGVGGNNKNFNCRKFKSIKPVNFVKECNNDDDEQSDTLEDNLMAGNKRFKRVHEMRCGQIGITDELHNSGDDMFPKNLTETEAVDLLNRFNDEVMQLKEFYNSHDVDYMWVAEQTGIYFDLFSDHLTLTEKLLIKDFSDFLQNKLIE